MQPRYLRKEENCILVPVLKLFVGLTITDLDDIYRPVFYLKHVSETILSPSSGGTYSFGAKRWS
jgi:hypothetical protein